VRDRASTFSFIAWCYITSGQGILAAAGWQDAAIQYAQSQVGGIFVEMKANPFTAMDDLFKQLPMIIQVSYYGAPLMLLLGTFAHLRKPKTFKTFG
ncbi:MAG: hypothetical protein ABIP02_00585, partial [Arenimonas sp.]